MDERETGLMTEDELRAIEAMGLTAISDSLLPPRCFIQRKEVRNRGWRFTESCNEALLLSSDVILNSCEMFSSVELKEHPSISLLYIANPANDDCIREISRVVTMLTVPPPLIRISHALEYIDEQGEIWDGDSSALLRRWKSSPMLSLVGNDNFSFRPIPTIDKLDLATLSNNLERVDLEGARIDGVTHPRISVFPTGHISSLRWNSFGLHRVLRVRKGSIMWILITDVDNLQSVLNTIDPCPALLQEGNMFIGLEFLNHYGIGYKTVIQPESSIGGISGRIPYFGICRETVIIMEIHTMGTDFFESPSSYRPCVCGKHRDIGALLDWKADFASSISSSYIPPKSPQRLRGRSHSLEELASPPMLAMEPLMKRPRKYSIESDRPARIQIYVNGEVALVSHLLKGFDLNPVLSLARCTLPKKGVTGYEDFGSEIVSLVSNIRKVAGKFSCPACPDLFGAKGNCVMHVLNKHSHHRRHACAVAGCSYRNNRRPEVRRHMLVSHPNVGHALPCAKPGPVVKRKHGGKE